MRFHVIGLPHTSLIEAQDVCAFTAKVRKFANMMHGAGHEVYVYAAGEQNEARCTEYVNIWSERDEFMNQYPWFAQGRIHDIDWNPETVYWQIFNYNAVKAVRPRLEPHDFICLITGWSVEQIIKAFPNHTKVEYGVGYQGIHKDTFHVFESYAWMHAVYAWQQGSAAGADGKFFDTVIPNYFEVEKFPYPGNGRTKDYLLFLSRMTPRKGYDIAIQLAERAQIPLKIAGIPQDRVESEWVEYVGLADPKLRYELFYGAYATLVPTIYLEPFGGVAVESLISAVPAITTDWGAFTETIQNGVNGFRCRSMKDFENAAHACGKLDMYESSAKARITYGTHTIAGRYEEYFQRLDTLWGAGFYA